MDCLVVIAALCFADLGKLDPGPEGAGLLRDAQATVGEATVDLAIARDAFLSFDTSAWERACAGEVCLSYHKWCGRQGDLPVCRYARADRHYPDWLVLSASSEPAIWQAERKLGVIVNGAVIPLTAFDKRSLSERPASLRDRPSRKTTP